MIGSGAARRPKAKSVRRLRVAAVHSRPDIWPLSAFERPLSIVTTANFQPKPLGQALEKETLNVRAHRRACTTHHQGSDAARASAWGEKSEPMLNPTLAP